MNEEFEKFEQCDSLPERVMKLTQNVQLLIEIIQKFKITNVKSISQDQETGDIIIETYDDAILKMNMTKEKK